MTDLQEGGQKWDANQSRAARMKMYRLLSGLSGEEASEMLNISSANYYRKELGLTTVSEPEVMVVRKVFRKWRTKEVELLKNRIEYLNLII